jgi:hypothetical protein
MHEVLEPFLDFRGLQKDLPFGRAGEQGAADGIHKDFWILQLLDLAEKMLVRIGGLGAQGGIAFA